MYEHLEFLHDARGHFDMSVMTLDLLTMLEMPNTLADDLAPSTSTDPGVSPLLVHSCQPSSALHV